ncbi:hypothetical protein [Nostoc sp. FACHB-190]|uniref:hypothetical protein n=1 Tax=Nostoc sp. FACHB-190 TaxID=2692838 RepID=UPI0016828D60|nr:hypothetical protein [Nostoc sp. FACHB-190]MBD2303622.1 hypothetical protein [Nostoc sp. FACHB-190]
MIDLQAAIAFHTKNLQNFDGGHLDQRKKEFYKQQLRVFLLALESGLDANKIRCCDFNGSHGSNEPPSVNFSVDGVNFTLRLVGDVLQLQVNGQTQLFTMPSESCATKINLAIAITERVTSQRRAIA